MSSNALSTGSRSLDCAACGALNAVEPDAVRWTCADCGAAYTFAVCPHCAGVVEMAFPDAGRWGCPICGRNAYAPSTGIPHVTLTVADTDARLREAARGQVGRPFTQVVRACRLLAVSGVSAKVGVAYALVCTQEGIAFSQTDTDTSIFYRYDEITGIEIGGPGRQTSGGGFIGGGFGAAGIVEGMLLAGVLNAMTTRTTTQTLVQIQTAESEMIFSHSTVTPQAMRLLLSPVFTFIRSAQQRSVAAAGPTGADIASRLTQLAALRSAGHLTDAECAAAKAAAVAGK